MRKLFYLLLIFTELCLAQNHPGEHLELMIGKELKVKEKSENFKTYGFNDFYKSPNRKQDNIYLYEPEKRIFATPYDSLVGKTFKLISFEKDSNYVDYYFLKLENPQIGILFYNYHSKSSYDFDDTFEVIGGFKLPLDITCKENITKEVDKFTKKVTYYSPILERLSYSKSGKSTYLSINVPGSTLNTNEKGLILLLNDGSKISRPNEKISVSYSDGYRYSAFILLSPIEIQRIIKNPITDVKLYIYDAEVFNPEKYSEFLKCLTKL